MNLADLMAAYSQARRIGQIIQRHDPSGTMRKASNGKQHDLIKKMDDSELAELFSYIERTDEMICDFGRSYDVKLSQNCGARQEERKEK